jgi:NAD(P)-dependent dehydrogenase (short-subunit alcohol dehydrogenase family)
MSETTRPLQGQTAVITGGGGGIGRATAALLVRDGAHVVVAGRTPEKLERITERLAPAAAEAGGSIRWRQADALDEDAIRALVALAAEPTGRLDMAVAVPGGGMMAPVLRYTADQIDDTMRRNITSAFILLKHAGGAMVRGGGGSFVAVSSMQALQTAPMLAAYCAAKAGLEMLCRTAADELGTHRVRVNCVRPGLTSTDATTGMVGDETTMAAYMEQQPLARVGEADDIAGAIRYLLGPESSWVTGQGITVDGGTTVRRFPDLTPLYQQRFGDEMAKAARGEIE